jgi:Tfp pilus assembly protein PilF
MRCPTARPRPRWRLLLVASAALAWAAAATAEPRVPAGDDEVLERLPAAAVRPAVEETPLAFARRALALGQETWNPRLVGRAEAALAPLLSTPEPALDARLLHAAILQNRHEFDAALAEIDAVLAREPHAAAAWLLRASILLVRGEPTAALASCARLLGRSDALVAATCAAQAAGRNGRARQAHAGLHRALSVAASPPPQIELWARMELAEIAWRLGELDQAERELAASLSRSPESAPARALYADLLLEQGRAAEARALFADPPRSEGLRLRLALAERALGAPAWRSRMRELEAGFAEARLRGGRAPHEREEARLALGLADDPARALTLARANFALQREPADARVLLEAARAANDPSAARPALDWIERTGLEDARLAALARELRGPGR